MLQDDFLMRQIKQLAQFLAALLGFAREGKLDEASVGVERAYLTYLGMRRSMVERLDVASLVTVLGQDKAKMAVLLLRAEAGLMAAQGQDGSARLARAAKLCEALGIAQDGSDLVPSEEN